MKFKEAIKNPNPNLLYSLVEKLGDNKLKKIRNLINKKNFLLLIVLFLLFMAFVSGVVAQRNYGFSNFIAKPIVLDSFGIIKRKVSSYFSNPELLSVDLKYEDQMKLMFTLKNAKEAGTIHGVENNWVNATVQNSGKSYKAKIKLKGGTGAQHFGDKWSFRLKLKDQKTLFGMREFAVMSPVRRNNLGQWFIRKVYEKEGLITRKYDFIKLSINGENKGIYVIDERYDKIMLERNQRKEAPVIKLDASPIFVDKVMENLDYGNYYLSMDLKAFDMDDIFENDVLKNQFLTAKTLMEKFRLGQLKTSQVFDIKLLAKWTAITDVMGAWHGYSFNNMRFYFNPITSKFEPVPDDDYNEWSLNIAADFRLFRLNDQYNKSFFLDNLFSDYDFVEEYIRQLVKFSDTNYLDQIFLEFNDEIKKLSTILAIDYPLYNFLLDSKNYTYENASSLREKLNIHKGIQAHFKEYKDNKIIELEIANNHSIPMEVLYLTDENSKIYKHISKENIIISGRKFMRPVDHNTYYFELSDNNANIEPSKLNITYRIIGTEKLLETEVFPYQGYDRRNLEADFIRQPSNVDRFSFLDWNKSAQEIKFKEGNWKISSDLIVPPNQKLIIPQGVTIDLINSAMILSYSPLLAVGSENQLIEIFSSDNTGQGVTVLNSPQVSLIKYVSFKGLSRPSKPGLELSGAINFYKSPVHIQESHFDSNKKGDDYLNLIRSDFTIKNSSISNSFADAIDIDFSNGSISESVFSNCGFGNNNGDCIDLSGSIVDIDNVMVNKASDKGISAGEQSLIEIKNSIITQSIIGLASKDLSEVTAENLTIKLSENGISVFQKKPEFGPAKVTIEELVMEDVSSFYFVEKGSFLSVDSVAVE